MEPSSWRPGAILEPSQERLGASRRRLGGVLGASWERLRAFGGRPGSLLGRLGRPESFLGRLWVSLEGSGVAVYLKRLESSKLLFFLRNFNDFVARSSNLVGRTSSSMGRAASMWAGTAALEAARTDSRCSQALPGAPSSSQESPGKSRAPPPGHGF